VEVDAYQLLVDTFSTLRSASSGTNLCRDEGRENPDTVPFENLIDQGSPEEPYFLGGTTDDSEAAGWAA